MYIMSDQSGVYSFEWDAGNLDKSYQKHGIHPKEAEEIFLDQDLLIIEDIKHQQDEPRFIALGKTIEKRVLFVVFTLRHTKVRVISARRAHRKERKFYEEKAQTNSSI